MIFINRMATHNTHITSCIEALLILYGAINQKQESQVEYQGIRINIQFETGFYLLEISQILLIHLLSYSLR